MYPPTNTHTCAHKHTHTQHTLHSPPPPHAGGIAYNMDEFKEIVNAGLTASMTSQVQVEQSLLGWKEYELEVSGVGG